MATSVGSVVVSVVANTAEYEAGMKRASAETTKFGHLVSQKSYMAADGTAKAAKAMEMFERRSLGAQSSIEATTGVMIAQQAGAGRSASMFFLLTTAYERLNIRARDTARALYAAGQAKSVAAAKAAILTKTLAALAAKMLVFAGGIMGYAKAWEVATKEYEIHRRKQEGSKQWMSAQEQHLRDTYDFLTKEVDERQKIIDAWKANRISLEEAIRLTRELASTHADYAGQVDKWLRQSQMGEQARAIEAVNDRYDEQLKTIENITDRKTYLELLDRLELGRARELQALEDARRQKFEDYWTKVETLDDWIFRRQMTRHEQEEQAIDDAFQKQKEAAQKIYDLSERQRVLDALEMRQVEELADLHAKRDEEAAARAGKAHEDRMKQYRDEAQAIRDLMDRTAGLIVGKGADAWRAITAAARQQSADDTQSRMVNRSGASTALDQDDKRNLADMREFLMRIATEEPVAI